jgi:hypothetical protein
MALSAKAAWARLVGVPYDGGNVDIIRDKQQTEAWEDCRARILQRICGYARYAQRFYFGFATDPDYRAARHREQKPWARRMVVLWQTPRADQARSAEQDIIRSVRKWYWSDRCENIRPGGEGVNSGGYLYMLVDTP